MNSEIENFIENPNNTLKLIDILNNCFSDLYYKASIENIKKLNVSDEQKNNLINSITGHSANSYYMNGHCLSYCEILHNIFGEYSTKYNSDNHVITKIGNYFYDVNGLINDRDLSKFHKSEMEDLYYIDVMLTNRDSLENFMEKELSQIGKEELQNLINKLNSNKQK